MSLNLSIYVGPYIEVSGVDADVIYDHDDAVYEVRGEAHSEGEPWIVAPNVALDGCDRETDFDKYVEPPIISLSAEDWLCEKQAFRQLASAFIEAVQTAGGTCSPIKWGIVGGIH